MMTSALPQGWYDDEEGRRRYWDGLSWNTPSPPPVDLSNTVSRSAKVDLLPLAQPDDPEAWQSQRTGTTWGAVILAVSASLVLHWLSQAIAGGVVGANVGVEGLLRITDDEFSVLNIFRWIFSLGITAFVAVLAGTRTHDDLTRAGGAGELRKMRWWGNCWAPILGGVAIFAFCFGSAFYYATSG